MKKQTIYFSCLLIIVGYSCTSPIYASRPYDWYKKLSNRFWKEEQTNHSNNQSQLPEIDEMPTDEPLNKEETSQINELKQYPFSSENKKQPVTSIQSQTEEYLTTLTDQIEKIVQEYSAALIDMKFVSNLESKEQFKTARKFSRRIDPFVQLSQEGSTTPGEKTQNQEVFSSQQQLGKNPFWALYVGMYLPLLDEVFGFGKLTELRKVTPEKFKNFQTNLLKKLDDNILLVIATDFTEHVDQTNPKNILQRLELFELTQKTLMRIHAEWQFFRTNLTKLCAENTISCTLAGEGKDFLNKAATILRSNFNKYIEEFQKESTQILPEQINNAYLLMQSFKNQWGFFDDSATLQNTLIQEFTQTLKAIKKELKKAFITDEELTIA